VTQRTRHRRPAKRALTVLLAAPDAADIARLLKAWRFWVAAGIAGALLGATAFVAFPPAYRASATVVVDFHMEQAWPQSVDREQFYYLERETRKLMEIAASDAVLAEVAAEAPGASVEELRKGILTLSQPGSGGWHFFADHHNAALASSLAGAWARAFAAAVADEVGGESNAALERFITVDISQTEYIVPERIPGIGVYVLAGATLMLALAALILLFVHVEP